MPTLGRRCDGMEAAEKIGMVRSSQCKHVRICKRKKLSIQSLLRVYSESTQSLLSHRVFQTNFVQCLRCNLPRMETRLFWGYWWYLHRQPILCWPPILDSAGGNMPSTMNIPASRYYQMLSSCLQRYTTSHPAGTSPSHSRAATTRRIESDGIVVLQLLRIPGFFCWWNPGFPLNKHQMVTLVMWV